MTIPKGTSKSDIETRRRIIEAHLGKIKGKSFRCPCLGGVPVFITSRGINETSAHASKTLKSTMAALQLPALIHNAKFYRMHLPKENGQKYKMKFEFIYELHSKTENTGICKLLIGVRISAQFLHYSITSM